MNAPLEQPVSRQEEKLAKRVALIRSLPNPTEMQRSLLRLAEIPSRRRT